MSHDNRPLSPHLQVYRLPLVALLSILHRITGFGLALGTLAALWWLFAVIGGEDSYRAFHAAAVSIPGRIMLFGWLFAFLYHFMNGLRHLVWDTGHGLDLPSAAKSSYAVIAATLLLTLLIWVLS